MCYPSSNITYCIACLLCIGVILLNKFNSIQSTNSPKYLKKSAPVIGLVTSAIVNFHVNDLANPRSNCTDLSPNVRIDDPLAACSCIPPEAFRRSPGQGGKTLISAPVSMR